MRWHKIRPTKSQINTGHLQALRAEFKRIWNLVGAPKDMALFAESPHEKKDGQCFIWFLDICLGQIKLYPDISDLPVRSRRKPYYH